MSVLADAPAAAVAYLRRTRRLWWASRSYEGQLQTMTKAQQHSGQLGKQCLQSLQNQMLILCFDGGKTFCIQTKYYHEQLVWVCEILVSAPAHAEPHCILSLSQAQLWQRQSHTQLRAGSMCTILPTKTRTDPLTSNPRVPAKISKPNESRWLFSKPTETRGFSCLPARSLKPTGTGYPRVQFLNPDPQPASRLPTIPALQLCLNSIFIINRRHVLELNPGSISISIHNILDLQRQREFLWRAASNLSDAARPIYRTPRVKEIGRRASKKLDAARQRNWTL